MREVIFETPNLKVLYVTAGEEPRCNLIVISFMSLIKAGVTYENGESETTIRRSGADAVHIIPASNRWYQYPEIFDVLDLIQSITRRYDRIVTYGMSMGGFAALQSSRFLKAHTTISYSPQISVDAAKYDFIDAGWQRKVRGAQFIWDDLGNVSQTAHHVVLYDPFHADSKHVGVLRKHVPLEEIVVPFAGHHSWRAAKHAGIGGKLLISLIHGDRDVSWARAALRDSRKSNPIYSENKERLWSARGGPAICQTDEIY